MGKKVTAWKTKGMNRDLSVSAFKPEFAFENMNLRLSTNEGNTLMSWVTERGPELITLSFVSGDSGSLPPLDTKIKGVPIGTCILNRNLILFTTDNISETHTGGSTPDRIYLIYYPENSVLGTDLNCQILYEGRLGFDAKYPLETMPYYEADHIQKVYWTDGINQPRIINIKDDILPYSGTGIDTQFDFVPSFDSSDLEVSIEKVESSSGLFAPGVIQYCFTYVNKYRQQSNIVYVSPIYYLTHSDRGGNPDDDKISCSFQITISNCDDRFDYVRLYSIQRTSLDGTNLVKKLEDIEIPESRDITFIDTGTKGSTLDPEELLFVGGKEINALTMIDKDNTLFMGNISQVNYSVSEIQDYFSKHQPDIVFHNGEEFVNSAKTLTLEKSNTLYGYTNSLKYNQREITTFKGGENYRFGFQLQKHTGEWTEPIYIGDATNTLYPGTNVHRETVNLVYASSTISLKELVDNNLVPIGELSKDIYQKIRPVIVFPTIGDRKVLCQGVLNPTVFNVDCRGENAPYAQSSWYFRPYMYNTVGIRDGENTSYYGLGDSITVTKSDYSGNSSDYDSTIALSKTMDVYILRVVIQGGEAQTAFNKVRHKVFDANSNTYKNYIYIDHNGTITSHEYKGIIFIEEIPSITYGVSVKIYAFVSTTPWNIPTSGSVGVGYFNDNEDYDFSDSQATVSNGNEIPFKIYSNIRTDEEGYLCYIRNEEELSDISYTFKFIDNYDNLFTVTFPPVGIISNNVALDAEGRGVQYHHFYPLYTQYEALQDSDSSPLISRNSLDQDVAKKVMMSEIQGSVNKYNTPYSTLENKIPVRIKTDVIIGGEPVWTDSVGEENKQVVDSNTEYFVDQSILTLNSPDIEFDPEVQVYNTDNLKLRIVGVVPITATASDHDIITSGAKLDMDTSNADTTIHKFGVGERNLNVRYKNYSTLAGNRLVADFLWNDVAVELRDEAQYTWTSKKPYNFLVYPWQSKASLNTDSEAEIGENNFHEVSSILETKKESNLLYSFNSEYFTFASDDSNNANDVNRIFKNIGVQTHLYQNDFIHIYRLPKQWKHTSDINYYANVDQVLYNTNGYNIVGEQDGTITRAFVTGDYHVGKEHISTSPISMKYKSGTHAVIDIRQENGIVRYPEPNDLHLDPDPNGSSNGYRTYWGDTNIRYQNSSISTISLMKDQSYNFLWLAELYKDVVSPFGGTSKEALRSNRWVIGGEEQSILDNGSLKDSITLDWTVGDTYYQRYDCLKTYAFTPDDPNQIVEILSFMCENRVNTDGRYDRNRGQIDNTEMHPQIFNLFNSVYSQKDNYFTSKMLIPDEKDKFTYPNQIYYSKTKQSGADVDMYTNVTLGSVLELDGDKGRLSKLTRFNDQVIAFQETGISQILYNENMQMTTTAGVPIEIANSGKVTGNRYYTNTVGCSNKWSVVNAPTGIYFMDDINKSIYLFNGQLANLSGSLGFDTWAKNDIPNKGDWSPVNFDRFVSYYDMLNQDVLYINNNTCLAYSEKIGAFTSFYSYEGIPYFCNFNDMGLWIKSNKTTEDIVGPQDIVIHLDNYDVSLYRHNAGEYCKFFGVNKPYSMTLVGNPDPQLDKTFTNIEFRATVTNEGSSNNTSFIPYKPFDTLETWNEYQHGIANLSIKNNRLGAIHHTTDNSAALIRKFRIWRCDIPRDNYGVNSIEEAKKGIYRHMVHKMDRMRNPWIYLKLKKNAAADPNSSLPKAEIHDIMMTYYV